MSTTATTSPLKSLCFADIEEALAKAEKLPKPEWMLISSDGRCWQGPPDKLLQVLLPYHPLLRQPTLSEILKDKEP